jgi:alanyl-tRNA synthetase
VSKDINSVDGFDSAQVEQNTRALMRAHTSSHLLYKILRAVIGEHVQQAGLIIEPDNLKFDFTHCFALANEDLFEIERLVNDAILSGLTVTAAEMSLKDLEKLDVTALLGEKSGDTVRVINIGDGYSIELCSGIHVDNTAKVGAFHITSEFSVALGVRRIEATTGKATLAAIVETRKYLDRLSVIVKAGTPDRIAEKLQQTMNAVSELRAKLDYLNEV